MNSPIKSILWYSFPFLVRNLIPLISLPFFTRYLLPDEFGSLALSIIYGVFIVGILNLGLISIFERNYFEQNIQSKRLQLMWTCIIFVFINLTIGTIITIQLEEFINLLIFGKNLPAYLTVLALIHLGLKSLLQYFYIYLRNSKKAELYAFISISEAVICVCLSIYFVFDKKGILGYILGQALGVGIMLIILTVLAMLKREIHFKGKLLKENLKLSLPLTPRVFFGTINTQFDRYMLGVLNTKAGVGIFDIGQKFANLGFIFMTVLQQVFAPEVFSTYMKKPNKFSKNIGEYLVPFFCFSLFFCLLLGLFSEEIIYLFTTPPYYKAFPIITILNMLYATYFFGKQPQLLLAKKTKLISILSLVVVILNIIINIPLINFFGIIGAAWGTFISGLITSLISFYFAQKYAKIEYSKSIYLLYFLFQISLFLVLLLWYFKINYVIGLFFRIWILFVFIIVGNKLNLIDKVLFKGLLIKK